MTTTINGRTPEEIKQGLECRASWGTYCKLKCSECDLYVPGVSITAAAKNALALIQQLESERDQYKRERDAAVKDIVRTCLKCAHREHKFLVDGKMDDLCGTCLYNNMCNWQWRGVEVE